MDNKQQAASWAEQVLNAYKSLNETLPAIEHAKKHYLQSVKALEEFKENPDKDAADIVLAKLEGLLARNKLAYVRALAIKDSYEKMLSRAMHSFKESDTRAFGTRYWL